MKSITTFVNEYWRVIVGSTIIIGVLVTVMGYSLGNLTAGYSEVEVLYLRSADSVKDIVSNPMFLPQKVPLFVVQNYISTTAQMTRLVSVIFGVVTISAFFFLARNWYSTRVAIFASLLFLVSSWFLNISRLAAPFILFATLSTLLLSVSYLYYKKQKSKIRFYLLLITVLMSLYIPGGIWLSLLVVILARKQTLADFKEKSVALKIIIGLLFAVAIAPIVYASIKDYDIAFLFFGLPNQLLPLEWVKRLFVVPVFLLAQGPFEPNYNLGRLPFLDIFTTALLIMGIYTYSFKLKLLRTKILIGFLAISVILVSLNTPGFIFVALPIILVVAAGGIALMLQQWFTVFPKNPIARSVGVFVLTTVILLTGFYHIQRYFVAWSGNPDTRNTFIYSLDK